MRVTVESLVRYPVKGCAGVALESAEVSVTGLVHDRNLMVVDAADGSFRSQRRLPEMAAIRAELSDDGARLTLSAPGLPRLEVNVVPDGARREVSMFGRPLGDAVDQGDEVAEWFSETLNLKSRLVRVPPGFDRDGWGETPGKVAFGDAHALLVTSVASLDHLNARIAARGGRPVPMQRFRPNIVLAGLDEPHAEDRVRRLSNGSVEIAYSVRAARCSVPLVDHLTGRRDGPEPVRTLATYRREPDYGGRVSFGIKAAVVRPGRIAVGDRIEVLAWADPAG